MPVFELAIVDGAYTLVHTNERTNETHTERDQWGL